MFLREPTLGQCPGLHIQGLPLKDKKNIPITIQLCPSHIENIHRLSVSSPPLLGKS